MKPRIEKCKNRIQQTFKYIARYFIKKFNFVELGLLFETGSKLKKSLDYTLEINSTRQINFILDVSGSLQNFKPVQQSIINYILSKNHIIHIIQIDTEIRMVKTISSPKEFKEMKYLGCGGTLIQPAFDYISQSKFFNFNQNVLFTDGYTEKLNVSNINKDILIVSTHEECEFVASNRRIEQIIIR